MDELIKEKYKKIIFHYYCKKCGSDQKTFEMETDEAMKQLRSFGFICLNLLRCTVCGHTSNTITGENICGVEDASKDVTETEDKNEEDISRRKVLFTSGMSNDFQLIITDAPKKEIEKWCYLYNDALEDCRYVEPFYTLKNQYYVKELHDSEVGNKEDIEVIGYDEVYELDKYVRKEDCKIKKITRSQNNAITIIHENPEETFSRVVYTEYNEKTGKTVIFEDIVDKETELVTSTTIKGYYFGEPNIYDMDDYYGHLKAEFFD